MSSFVETFVILKVLDMAIDLPVAKEGEAVDIDLSEHGECGYV